MSLTITNRGASEPKGSHRNHYEDETYAIEKEQQLVADQDLLSEPSGFKYLSIPVVSHFLTESQKKWLRHRPQVPASDHQGSQVLPVVRLPLSKNERCTRIEVRRVTDQRHPAYGQFGLFASRHLNPEELIIPYIGYVHSSTASESTEYESQFERDARSTLSDTFNIKCNASSRQILDAASAHFTPDVAIGSWDASSYDLNLYRDEDIELAIDAASMGNEARFCNDYRNVPMDRPSLASCKSQRWSRKTKRAAKSWNVDNNTTGGASHDAIPDGIEPAIPNAEFRDVWVEWAVDDHSHIQAQNEEGNSHNDLLSMAQKNLKSLDTGDVGHNNNIVASFAEASNEIVNPEFRSKDFNKRKRRKKAGMRGIAIFVLPAGKSGKRKAGIQPGQEILVSYGKGFWAHYGSKAL